MLCQTLIMNPQPTDNLNSYIERAVSRAAEAHDEAELRQVAADTASEVRACMNAERLAAASRMAAWLAHQINNPLGTISGNAQLLARRLHRDFGEEADLPIYLRYVEGIQSQTERCALITGDLLGLTRPVNLELRRVDIRPVVREACQLARFGRGGREVTLGPGFEGEPPPVAADREALVRVVYEVVVNAVQAAPEGGAVSVDAVKMPSRAERPRWIAIRVTDSGPGIPREILSRIFDPFFSTKEKARGLGLTTGLELMRQMRGTVRVEKTGPTGTAVAIRIPAAVPRG